MEGARRESVRPRFQDIVLSIVDSFQEEGFEEVEVFRHEEVGYTIYSQDPKFEMWIELDGEDLIIRNIEIQDTNFGTGTKVINSLKELALENGYFRLLAHKVLESSWDFWVNKCGFTRDGDDAFFELH